MPFGKWENFGACVADIMKTQGKDEESARKICGALQARLGKESFSWVGNVQPYEKNLVRGKAIHPVITVHPEEWPSVRVYLEEELKKAAHTLAGTPLILDHLNPINGKVLAAAYEDGAIEYVAELNDEQILNWIRDGKIRYCSVEYDWSSLEKVNGVAPKGIKFMGLALLKNFEPGDPAASVEIWRQIGEAVKEIKEAKLKEQTQPQDFIIHPILDLSAFMPEHFQVNWVDQNLGVQALYGRLVSNPESIQPFALLFMKASGWDPAKIETWLHDHPQYSRASLAPLPVGLQVSPLPPQVRGIETLNEEELKNYVESLVKAEFEKAGEESRKQKKIMKGFFEAEWSTAFINDLPDSAFAVIGSGGEKDDQGKTVPRTLRHLPHHNAQGDLDLAHLRNALARMNQIEPASLRAEAKRHLCAHAKDSEIVSEFCGEEPSGQEKCSTGLGEALIDPSGSKTSQNDLISREKVVELLKANLPSRQVVFSHGQGGGFRRLYENIKRVMWQIEKGEV